MANFTARLVKKAISEGVFSGAGRLGVTERRAVRQYDIVERAVDLKSRYLGLGGLTVK